MRRKMGWGEIHEEMIVAPLFNEVLEQLWDEFQREVEFQEDVMYEFALEYALERDFALYCPVYNRFTMNCDC